MVTIIKDKEAIYDTEQYDVVLMGLSTHNIFMGNFQGKMAVKYPIVEKVNDSTPYGDIRKLGKCITIHDNTPIISLMYICTYPSRKDNFIDYEGLRKCLETANNDFKGKKVMTTLLGSTKFDGKGDREKCLKIIEETTKDYTQYYYPEDYSKCLIYGEPLSIDFTIDGETTQTGTPTPLYPIPIVNKTGTVTQIINNREFTFNLGNIQLCQLGEYQDYIHKYNGAWYIHREIEGYILLYDSLLRNL